MKYKMPNSKEVQRKAERLGCVEGCTKFDELAPFIIVSDDIYYSHGMYNVHNMDVQEITQKDFLALPEPLMVGDWVKSKKTASKILIGKISRIIDEDIFELDGISNSRFNAVILTKLTPEQIKILGLED